MKLILLFFAFTDSARIHRHMSDNATTETNETKSPEPSNSTNEPPHHYGAIAKSPSVIHPSLLFPLAELVPIRTTGNASDSFALFCGSKKSSSSNPVVSMGDGFERYTMAVNEKIVTTSKPPVHDSFLFLRNLRRHARRASEYVFISPDVYGGKCSSDSDCISLSPRKYCLDGLCRECSSGSDCPAGLNEFCSASTGYTCSDCETDDDCDSDSGAVCRAVFPDIAPVPMMPRKQCTTCARVPESAELYDVTRCAWRCPFGTSRSSDDSACILNPTCSAAQYLGPSSDEKFFYTPGVNAVNPSCINCAVPFGDVFDRDEFCAVLVNSTFASMNGIPVGDLNHNDTVTDSRENFPCSKFTCKEGWTLNGPQNQCQECRYSSCDPGFYLDGCRGNSTGNCTACSPALLQNDPHSDWIELAKVGVPLNMSADPTTACTTICREGFYRSRSNDSCTSCEFMEQSACRIGQILEKCGPGYDTGKCMDCPPAAADVYWTGNKCSQASCSDKSCPPGSILKGCGFGEPGRCTPCPGGLPSHAVNWVKGCDFTCEVGSFVQYVGEPGPLSLAEANRTCTSCSEIRRTCPDGTMLAGCGLDGTGQGMCRKCNPAGLGMYYTAETECKPHRCDVEKLCRPGEQLFDCGFGNRGRCEGSGL